MSNTNNIDKNNKSNKNIDKKNNKTDNLIFTTIDNEEVEFEVIEQTMINGINYLLVCDANDNDDLSFILKEVNIDDKDVIYDEVVDDIELNAVAKVFAELLDDCDIQID